MLKRNMPAETTLLRSNIGALVAWKFPLWLLFLLLSAWWV